ncbi:TP53-regulating kinase [Portunus trituberculatus]|uniref:non-specific serine/threonine protein kinase n=1 Tax=Portunus trituberculatus TaxID=210409 RepID=A0A5B7CGN7_PORTR|nr:TP53-regulating kinase [Portunus trituberculatus]
MVAVPNLNKKRRMDRQLVTQGAEGRVYVGDWLNHSVIIKQRFSKKYRHVDLDTHITQERIKAEARALTRCRSLGIRTPAVYDPYESSEVILIDFGLSSVEERAEDKAVDLYVLERAVLSTHPNTEAFVSCCISAYKKAGSNAAEDVVKRLDEVRTRGRKKIPQKPCTSTP